MMKKIIIPLAVIFIAMSSFTLEIPPTDCDAIAEDFYYGALQAGHTQEEATHAYMYSFETCTYEDGGSSIYTTQL